MGKFEVLIRVTMNSPYLNQKTKDSIMKIINEHTEEDNEVVIQLVSKTIIDQIWDK